MRDSGGSSGKAIKITPEELIFDQVAVNQTHVQQLTFKNNLSAPVELVLKSSNTERTDIEPKQKKLAPFESFVADVTIRVTKAFPSKTTKHRDIIFLKSDFFDQKVNVTIIPSPNANTQSTTPRDTSLGSSIRFGQSQINLGKISASRRDTSRDSCYGQSRNYSPKKMSTAHLNEMEKELDTKARQITDLTTQLRKQEHEAQNAHCQLEQESAKCKELQDRFNTNSNFTHQEQIEQIKALLREREPNLEQLMELTLKKEREQQERKDTKVLEILKIKDRQVEELQHKAVSQEAEYGRLAQSYQEAKKMVRQLDEVNQQQHEQIQQLSGQLESLVAKVNQQENSDQYQKLRQQELQLSEASQFIEKLQYQLQHSDQALSEKQQTEGYFEEALDRLRLQLGDRDNKASCLEKELSDVKETKIRQEEHIKSLMNQITQLNSDAVNERNLNMQKMKADSNIIERVSKIQEEKNELLNAMNQSRKEAMKDQDQLRYILDRLTGIRGLQQYGQASHQLPLMVQLERKVEEVARVVRELEDDNIDMNSKIKRQSETIGAREQELQSIIEEHEELQRKVCTKKKNNGTQTQIDSNEMDDLLHNYDNIRGKAIELEEENEALHQEITSCQMKLRDTRQELDRANQEISLLMKNHQRRKHSPSTQSEITPHNQSSIGGKAEQDEVVSRLNAKITNMKLNEEKLVDQINSISHQLQESGSTSHRLRASSVPQKQQRNIGLEERLGEYEIILMEQREQLIRLEQDNGDLKRALYDTEISKENEINQLSLKLQNIQEISKKYEQIQMSQSASVDDYQLKTVGNSPLLGFSQSNKSTAVETERMRQYAQQIELNNMGLKHGIEEMRQERDQAVHQLDQVKDFNARLERDIIRLRQDSQLKRVGLDSQGIANDGEKLVHTISEQRSKIKKLEGLLVRAKQDFDRAKHPHRTETDQASQGNWSGQRLEDVLKTNEQLRQDQQQAIAVVMDLKEEYANKLMTIQEMYEVQRQKLKQESTNLQRKVETHQSQISYMEKKEVRLFGQLEEAKSLQQQETEEKERRTRELEELLFQKEETMNELEREIKQKDRSLIERQDQIAVLIDTLEHDHSSDDLRQKVLNLSAELCSLKAIEAQQEKKVNELTHLLRKAELNSAKGLQTIDKERIKFKDQHKELKKVELDNDQLQQKVQEMQLSMDNVERESSEWKYKAEREEFQLKLKEETVQQMRQQIRRGEQLFKQEIERLKKDIIERDQAKGKFNSDQTTVDRTLPFKSTIQQLHLVVADFLENGAQHTEKQVIVELERVLGIASATIEKIQTELDKERVTNCKLLNEHRALGHNQILLNRLESMTYQVQRLQAMFNAREDERGQYIQQKEQGFSQIIKEQEVKIQLLDRQLDEIQEDYQLMKSENYSLKSSKEELEMSLLCFQQELESQKQAMERKAELTVDERFKSKHESVKGYFDSNITKILLNHGGSDKCLELGREICSLKLLASKLESKIIAEQSEREGMELSLSHHKDLVQQYEAKVRELQVKISQSSNKLHNQDLAVKMEMEKKKQENLQLQKELMKVKQQVEEKTRANLSLQEQVSKEEWQDTKHAKEEVDAQIYEDKIKTSQSRVEQLQGKLIEIRSQHIEELNQLKLQYDVDMVESKRRLQKEKDQLVSRYLPGNAPGDLLDQNNALRGKLVELKQAHERLTQENVILRKKLESEKSHFENQRRETQAHRQAISELETTFTEISHHQNSVEQANQQQLHSQSRVVPEETKRRSSKGTSNKKRAQLHFNKDLVQSEEREQSHSKILLQDSSLNVSALTSVNLMNQKQSSIHGGTSTKQFIINPPVIVRALIQNKINEMLASKKVEELAKSEIELREQYKGVITSLRESESQLYFVKQKLQRSISLEETWIDDQQKRMIELEVENEDLKIEKAQGHLDALKSSALTRNENTENLRVDYPLQDYSTLVEALLSLSTQLAINECITSKNEQSPFLLDPNGNVQEAQRLVIKALLTKIAGGRSLIDLQYIPSEEHDRKVWYLELLEQQVEASDQSVQILQNFIKKLQIEISGNLQSAAQIKAASMDLAQNTKKTSEEVKTLKHIASLVKHDLLQMMGQHPQKPTQHSTTLAQTINPFVDNIDQRAHAFNNPPSNLVYEQFQQNSQQLQNQLTISEKVKKTLENEIIQLKIAQTGELKSLKTQLLTCTNSRDSLLQTNEELHGKVLNLETHLENLKHEIQQANQHNESNFNALMDKEREKEALAKNKTATSKHLQKLQQDVTDWRKQTDENMKAKEKQVQDLTIQNQSLSKEKDRLKAENQMLRRNEKDRQKGPNEEVAKLEELNQELHQKLSKEIEDRQKEIEFWVTERATMREMIDQLESERAGVDINAQESGSAEDQLKSYKKKAMKKFKQKDVEIRNKEKQLQELRDELNKLKQAATQLEQRIRESSTHHSEAEERVKYLQQKIKQVCIEKDLVLAEKNNAISTNDLTAQQIQEELNSLRECFSKLKVERDNLLYEMETTQLREKEQKQAADRLKDQIETMESHLASKDKDQGQQIRHLDSKNAALLQDLKFIRQENERLKTRIKDADASVLDYQQKLLDEDKHKQEVKYQCERLQLQIGENGSQLRDKESLISDLQGQIILNESSKLKEIEGLRVKLSEVKEANAQLLSLYENQLEILRAKFQSELKKPDQKTEQMFSLAQREAVIKNLKKENAQLKSQFTKVKAKNKELKLQSQNQENTTNNTIRGSGSQNKSAKHPAKSSISNLEYEQQDKAVMKIAQMLSQDDGFKAMLQQLQRTNEHVQKVAELESQLAKNEQWNIVISQQLQEQQDYSSQLSKQIEDLSKKDLKESKHQKSSQVKEDASKQYRQEVKSLQGELRQLKSEWISPQDFKSLQDQLRDHQTQVRSLKEELQRKREVITQMKQQRDQTEVEANQIMADMEGLKDDNVKLQKLIRENSRNQQQLKELKSTNDYLKAQEKRLKEEISSQNDKLKSVRLDLQRKEQIARDLRDKMDSIQDEVGASKDRHSEIDKFRDLAKKNRLEADIKENQVRTLKQKLDHTEEELSKIKEQSQSTIMNSHSNHLQIENQAKISKNKLKKYEAYLKKSLEALKKIGKELSTQNIKSEAGKKKSSQADDPLVMSELDREMYKDSVDILGVSMDELAEFMNPSEFGGPSNRASDVRGESITFISKLDKACEIPDSLNQDIDHICNYCVKLIGELR